MTMGSGSGLGSKVRLEEPVTYGGHSQDYCKHTLMLSALTHGIVTGVWGWSELRAAPAVLRPHTLGHL